MTPHPYKPFACLGIRILKRGEAGKPTYGLCWYEDYQNIVVIAPVGLNLIYAGARALYHYVQFGMTSRLSTFGREDDMAAANALNKLLGDAREIRTDGANIHVVEMTGAEAIQYAANRLRGVIK